MVRRVLIGFLVLIVLVVATVVFGPSLIPLGVYKTEIARQVKRATGRDLVINGDLRLNVFPHLELEARDVTFANAPGSAEPHLVRLDELDLRVPVLPLLFGRIEVDRFVLKRPVIHMEIDKAGKPSWDLAVARKTEANPERGATTDTAFEIDILRLADIRLEDGTVKLLDRRSNDAVEVTGVNILFDVPEDETGTADRMLKQAPEEKAAVASRQLQDLLDVRILPAGFYVRNARLDVAIARLNAPDVEVRDLSFRGEAKDGRMASSPFAITVGGTKLSGTVAMDLRGAEPRSEFRLESGRIDIGKVLDRLRIAKGVDSALSKSNLRVAIRGRSPRQMMESLDFLAGFEGGHITAAGLGKGGKTRVMVRTAAVVQKPGQRLTLNIDGSIEKIPVEIRVSADPLLGFAARPDRLSLRSTVKAVGVTLEIRGNTALPIDRELFEIAATLKGQSLASVSPLVDVALPPLGPYSLDAKVTGAPGRYALSNLDMRFGKSDLRGKGTLDFRAKKPRIDLTLATKTLQIDDFVEPDMRPTPGGKPAARAEVKSKTGSRDGGTGTPQGAASDDPAGTGDAMSETLRSFYDPELMQSFDATLAVDVGEVLSGVDRLGQGSLRASLANGRLEVSKLRVAVPGGAVDVNIGFKPEAKSVSTDLAIRSKAFDYGILARRIDPKAEPEGTMDLDIALKSKAPTVEDLMSNASGRFNFAVYPRNMEADIFDLWAANLVLLLLSTADKQSKSTSSLNCLVGRFTMTDGIMKRDALLMDTTNMFVSGDVNVNFKTRRIDASLAPKAKRPRMFSAPLPIQVKGSFDDFDVGVNAGDVVGTAIQFVTSIVVVPFRWVFEGPLPEDGRPVCRAAMAGTVPTGAKLRTK